jgi:Sigma-70 region 2
VSLYAPLIYAWGRHVGLQDPDAADLVQEVFVKLVQVRPTFRYNAREDRSRKRSDANTPRRVGPPRAGGLALCALLRASYLSSRALRSSFAARASSPRERYALARSS